MSLWLDKKYLNLVSGSLEQFKWKSSNLANFRCNFCGDSKKNKYKARGYFFEKKGSFIYTCHNCHVGMNFSNFLKQTNPNLYRQYVAEKFMQKPLEVKGEEFISKNNNIYWVEKIDLPKISDLSNKHIAYRYLKDRKLPDTFFNELYYAEDFKKFIDDMVPNHGKKLYQDEARLIIPFYDKDNKLVGITGRSLDPKNKTRYMIISIDDAYPKIYGLNKFDKGKKTYVTEGIFDSMFLENGIAAAGSNLIEVLPFVDKENSVFIWDNEPRNKFITGAMEGAINRGCHVFFWPNNIQTKDINDYILSGHTASEIMFMIDKHSKSGLQAKLELQKWRKA